MYGHIYMFTSLRVRLLLLVLLAVLPSLGLIVYTASERRRLTIIEAQGDALRMARLTASNYQQLIESGYYLLVSLGQLPAVREGYPRDCESLFPSLLKRYPSYTGFAVSRLSGEVYCSAPAFGQPISFSDRPWLRRLSRAREFVVGEYEIGHFGKANVILAHLVFDESNDLLAIVTASLDLESLENLAMQADLPVGATLTVIDRNGTILVHHPNREKMIGQQMPEESILRMVLTSKEGAGEIQGLDGVPSLMGFASILSGQRDPDAYVTIRIPIAVAYARADSDLLRNLAALGLVTVLAVGASWFGGSILILRRVNDLFMVTKQLSAGDLSARTRLPYGSSELSELASAFDEMATALEQREAERARSETLIRRQAAFSRALVHTAVRLNSQLDLENVLTAVCEETAHSLNVPATSVRLLNERCDALYYAADYGLPLEKRHLAHPIPLSVYDDYITRMSPIIVLPDVRLMPDLPDAERFARLDIRSVIITGMVREGQLVGSLNIYTFETRHFTDDELVLVQGLAHQAALAIANARLYDALQREEWIRANLLRQIITAQEDERTRIARELHDVTSQSVSALVVGLESARIALTKDIGKVDGHLRTAKSIAEGVEDDVYRMIVDLRPLILDDFGLVPAIAAHGKQRLGSLDIAFHLDADGLPRRLPPAVETTLFRIFQEALTNVIRHSRAFAVRVQLTQHDGFVTLQVADDGQGFGQQIIQDADSSGSGLGLRGIRERASILGGDVQVTSTPGEGTIISVKIPLLQRDLRDA